MKVLHIQLFDKSSEANSSVSLARASELSSFSFLQKGSIGEFLNFFSKTVSDRTAPGQRQSIQEQSYTFHVFCIPNSGDLTAVMVTDEEYPVRVAFGLLNKVTDEWQQDHPKTEYELDEIQWPKLSDYLRKYQDPKQADQIMKVQQELDETKIILHKTIESVLERGQKLDSLVERSENLSAQSKMFYKSAKKQNSCCVIM
ncbi:snare protein YKT6 [Cystobasidium minutum MCA 4210]|uniref:snare protein YKT6 n=1 Tax=Cystobasidium minutum MCA 4210 TaxID=1397322 RepID=UPI0034CD2001|eukprot:jgi/Rhomi1/143230/e_gw1.3.61.1